MRVALARWALLLFAAGPWFALGAAGCSASVLRADASVDTALVDAQHDGEPRTDGLPDTHVDGPVDGASDGVSDGGADGGAGDASGPAAPCPGPGAGGHLKLVSAYWAGTAAYGDHLSELSPALQVGHVDLARLKTALPAGLDVIVDLHWHLFDYTTHTVSAKLDERIDAIGDAIKLVRGRVRAFYLIDEPYVAGHLIPRPELEKAIAALKTRFPEIPSYITFAHHCFDPAATDSACALAPSARGIPSGLTWVGFDWYNDSNNLAVAATHVSTHIATGVARIAQLAPSAKIIVVPEAYTDGNRVEASVVATLYDYFSLAAQQPSIFGVDFFLWANVPPPENFQGLRSLPAARAAARGFARWVRKGCGETADRVPITQWYTSAGPDYRYEPWLWDGRAQGYRVDGVAFALAPANTPGTQALVHCLVNRGSSVDSYLTVDPACDGAPVSSPGVVIGGIYPTKQPGTVQLHRYAQQQAPWDHGYALSASAPFPAGYAYEWPIGWVYPPSAL